jgi:hypothetical protein
VIFFHNDQDALRTLCFTLNGLAGIAIINGDHVGAIKNYLAVLKLSNPEVKTGLYLFLC